MNGKYGCNENANIKVLDQVDGKSHGAGGEHQNVHFGAQLHCFVLYKRFQMFMVQFCSQKPTVESVRTFGKEKRSCQKQRCGGQSGDYNAYRTAYQTKESQSQIDMYLFQNKSKRYIDIPLAFTVFYAFLISHLTEDWISRLFSFAHLRCVYKFR